MDCDLLVLQCHPKSPRETRRGAVMSSCLLRCATDY